MNDVKTGINDLDKILGGGFPQKTIILVSGDAGSGKTLFGLNFVVQGAKAGEKCCYVSLSENEEELSRACQGIDSLKDVENYVNKNLIFKYIAINEKTSIEDFIKTFSAYPYIDKLVIDNVNKLLMHSSTSKNYRLHLAELSRYLKKKCCCSILLCETKKDELDSGNNEAFETDGVIKLSFSELEEKPFRIMEIHKLRYSEFDPKIPHVFAIRKEGIKLTEKKII